MDRKLRKKGILALFLFVTIIVGGFFALRAVRESAWWNNLRNVKVKYSRAGQGELLDRVVSRFNGLETEFVSSTYGARFRTGVSGRDFYENPPLLAVMIDNHADSRPASGLASAEVVYEIPTEGNITRFMALFSANEFPERVGPVRSSRPYFLDYLLEWGRPLYLHVGGSIAALDRLRGKAFNDLNEYSNGEYFFRVDGRKAPHSTFTGRETLFGKDGFGPESPIYEKVTSTDYFPLKFATSTDGFLGAAFLGATNAPLVKIGYVRKAHDVSWTWNTKDGVYERLQAGARHRDSNGDAITANTIVIQEVGAEVMDSVGRIKLNTVGSGKVWVMAGGRKIEGVWKKTTRIARTQFFTDYGKQIALAPGHIWFEIVTPGVVVGFE